MLERGLLTSRFSYRQKTFWQMTLREIGGRRERESARVTTISSWENTRNQQDKKKKERTRWKGHDRGFRDFLFHLFVIFFSFFSSYFFVVIPCVCIGWEVIYSAFRIGWSCWRLSGYNMVQRFVSEATRTFWALNMYTLDWHTRSHHEYRRLTR